MAYGMQGHLKISFQDSFGTANTGSFYSIPLISETITENIPPIVSEGMKGRFEEGDSYEGAHDIGGDLVFEAHPILLGVALTAWAGQSSGTLTDSTYTHQIKPIATDWGEMSAVPPMTIEVYRDAGSAHQYYDMCCNDLSIEIAHGAIVKCTMSMLGGKFGKVAKTAASYLPGSYMTWDQSSISVAGTGIDEISTMTINAHNNLEGRGTLDGTKTFNRMKRSGYRTVDVAGTMLFVNDDEFDNWRDQTEQRLDVTVTGQAVSSGYNATLEIDIPSMRYDNMPVNIGGPGVIEASYTAQGKYNSGSATAIEFTLINTAAGYGDF